MEQIYKSLQGRQVSIMGSQSLFKSSVLVPLVEHKGELCVLFEERAHHMKRQPGEICFPGGRIDPSDRNELDAAIRETCEELGLSSSQVEPVGSLDYIVTPFQIVHPFVGRINDIDGIQPNADEVASWFCVPLSFLQKAEPELHYVDLQMTPPEEFPFALIPNGRNYKWRAGKIPEYFYFYEDRIIWGLTARILHHFLEVIGSETTHNRP